MCDILLVEDNPNFRRMLYDSLATRFPKADIEAVESGEAAIEKFDCICPRIIFLDLALPGINGLQVTEQIRSKNEEVVIAVVTANDFPEYREAAGIRGADFFISKNTARLEEILALAGALIEEEPGGKIPERYRI
jgi:CheY-like chemotaxis protein